MILFIAPSARPSPTRLITRLSHSCWDVADKDPGSGLVVGGQVWVFGLFGGWVDRWVAG